MSQRRVHKRGFQFRDGRYQAACQVSGDVGQYITTTNENEVTCRWCLKILADEERARFRAEVYQRRQTARGARR